MRAKFHADPSNRLATVHQRYRQTGQWTDIIGRTVLQTVAQKPVVFDIVTQEKIGWHFLDHHVHM